MARRGPNQSVPHVWSDFDGGIAKCCHCKAEKLSTRSRKCYRMRSTQDWQEKPGSCSRALYVQIGAT